MFEAMGKFPELNQAIEYVENVVSTATNMDGQINNAPNGSLGWYGWGWGWPQDEKRPVPLYESVFWRYATKLLRTIRFKGRAWNYKEDGVFVYRSTYANLLAFAERHIFDKWAPTGMQRRHRTHMAAHWAFIARNLEPLTSDSDRQSKCRELYRRFDEKLSGQIRPQVDGAWLWNQSWDDSAEPPIVQDVSHGSHVLAYMLDENPFDATPFWFAYTPGGYSTSGLDKLLLRVVWNGNVLEPRFKRWVDGTGSWKTIDQSTFADGWLKLGHRNEFLQRIFENFITNSFQVQYYGNLALNAVKLSGFRKPTK
jgi:hypothetical protein